MMEQKRDFKNNNFENHPCVKNLKANLCTSFSLSGFLELEKGFPSSKSSNIAAIYFTFVASRGTSPRFAIKSQVCSSNITALRNGDPLNI